jgi:uncharacterized protein YfdQ (DUF2303 family)
MINKEAIDAMSEAKAIENAFKCLAKASEANNITALPSDYKLHDLERFLPQRRRVRGLMQTPFVRAFAAYVKTHMEAGASVFVDPAKLGATAVLNLGGPSNPGHADNLAKLTPEKTAAYAALQLQTLGNRHLTQKEAAEFMEDWSEHIQCFSDAGHTISNPRAVAAVRKITIDAMRKLESTEQSLSASRSAFESVQASSTEPLPSTIYFKCRPFADLAERLFVLRLGVITTDDKAPKITLRIAKAEQHAEEMAVELCELVLQHMELAMGSETTRATLVPVLIGAYTKSD